MRGPVSSIAKPRPAQGHRDLPSCALRPPTCRFVCETRAAISAILRYTSSLQDPENTRDALVTLKQRCHIKRWTPTAEDAINRTRRRSGCTPFNSTNDPQKEHRSNYTAYIATERGKLASEEGRTAQQRNYPVAGESSFPKHQRRRCFINGQISMTYPFQSIPLRESIHCTLPCPEEAHVQSQDTVALFLRDVRSIGD